MHVPDVSFLLFTGILVVFCIVVDVFLQQVMRVNSVIHRMLISFGLFFIIQHIIFPRLFDKNPPAEVVVEQVPPRVSSLDHIVSYLNKPCEKKDSENTGITLSTEWGSISFSNWDAA